ncbi:MAG: GGDEF domain-containing protein [Parvularculaceae bacterium]|nr:GGDEF domain-containing protein [Parvularculaceae bacterium]
MKVSGTRSSGKATPIRKSRPAAGADAARAPEAVDSISIAGIPEAELTPRVREALTGLMQEVAALRRELEAAHEQMRELETLAHTDPLLGVLNRRAFVAELNRALAMIDRYGQPSSLVFIDLDNLKMINDAGGHAAGDAALEHVAQVISSNIRQTDVFGRLGGDEFAVILTNAPHALAIQKADMLAHLVRTSNATGKAPVTVTCGVVEMKRGATVKDALEEADRIMYEGKKRR